MHENTPMCKGLPQVPVPDSVCSSLALGFFLLLSMQVWSCSCPSIVWVEISLVGLTDNLWAAISAAAATRVDVLEAGEQLSLENLLLSAIALFLDPCKFSELLGWDIVTVLLKLGTLTTLSYRDPLLASLPEWQLLLALLELELLHKESVSSVWGIFFITEGFLGVGGDMAIPLSVRRRKIVKSNAWIAHQVLHCVQNVIFLHFQHW